MGEEVVGVWSNGVRFGPSKLDFCGGSMMGLLRPFCIRRRWWSGREGVGAVAGFVFDTLYTTTVMASISTRKKGSVLDGKVGCLSIPCMTRALRTSNPRRLIVGYSRMSYAALIRCMLTRALAPGLTSKSVSRDTFTSGLRGVHCHSNGVSKCASHLRCVTS